MLTVQRIESMLSEVSAHLSKLKSQLESAAAEKQQRESEKHRRTQARPAHVGAAQLFGGNSTGLFCLPVLNSMILRVTPGRSAEIGLTRNTGAPGVPTIS